MIELEEDKAQADAKHGVHGEPDPEYPNVANVVLEGAARQGPSLMHPSGPILRVQRAVLVTEIKQTM